MQGVALAGAGDLREPECRERVTLVDGLVELIAATAGGDLLVKGAMPFHVAPGIQLRTQLVDLACQRVQVLQLEGARQACRAHGHLLFESFPDDEVLDDVLA